MYCRLNINFTWSELFFYIRKSLPKNLYRSKIFFSLQQQVLKINSRESEGKIEEDEEIVRNRKCKQKFKAKIKLWERKHSWFELRERENNAEKIDTEVKTIKITTTKITIPESQTQRPEEAHNRHTYSTGFPSLSPFSYALSLLYFFVGRKLKSDITLTRRPKRQSARENEMRLEMQFDG